MRHLVTTATLLLLLLLLFISYSIAGLDSQQQQDELDSSSSSSSSSCPAGGDQDGSCADTGDGGNGNLQEQQEQQQSQQQLVLPAVDDVGRLGLYMLKRIWGSFDIVAQLQASGVVQPQGISVLDVLGGVSALRELKLLLDTIGLGLEPTFTYLQQQGGQVGMALIPSFDEFENWVEENAWNLETEVVARLNSHFGNLSPPQSTLELWKEIDRMEDVLSQEDLEHWEREGYVILHDAVSEEDLEGTRNAIWDYIGATPDNVDSWYTTINQKGINVQLYDHPYFEKNRKSKRIHKAYSQLWNTTDLWMSTDRASFNPPERPEPSTSTSSSEQQQPIFTFPGPFMHWDAMLMPPIPMSTQGLLYLNDVEANQGAFTLVPKFHLRVDEWLWEIAAYGGHPQDQDFEALGAIPIAGKAGDLIIWDHRLPHGGRPNTATFPRMVQYLNMLPSNICEHQPKPLPEQSCNSYGQCSTGECSSVPNQVLQ